MRRKDEILGASEMARPRKKMSSAPSLYVCDRRLRYLDPVTNGRASPGGMSGRKFDNREWGGGGD